MSTFIKNNPQVFSSKKAIANAIPTINYMSEHDSKKIKTLPRLFESLKNIIDVYVIVDTGSTDGTQEYITDYMREIKMPGQLHKKPWVDFEANHQIALDLEKKKSI